MTTVDNRRKRLQRLITEKYGTQAEFIRQTGENQGEISAIVRGAKGFGEKKARKLEAKAGLPTGWLDLPDDRSGTPPTGGQVSYSADPYNFPTLGDNFETGPDLRPRLYPEISWVQAGMWTEIADNFEPAAAQDWHYCHKDLGAHGFMLRVKGFSMTAPPGQSPSFPEGMLLGVNPDAEALPGKFVVVRRNGNEATFKKLTMVDGDPYLEALNPDWPNRFIPMQKDDQICGVIQTATFEL
ncbi:LexA family transcriptional regulator [Cupriavidus respiraculi]|uniref:Peptidase S24/S26A/S26B/S26C domain-containing protein n=1 Tax=Cupriavidus respiraculi TaxID=195930 RepID=A0ABN7ZIW1_9BURK|nr:XRE family transcriptional regulator [Cupriavidus respiraculi]CAG9184201.1 hypothetical protein LMG21510_05038 [Cupriavidus respiraculi]